MHLTDRATNILARLLAEPALRECSLILIGHSLGGLIIKQLLRTAESEARHRDDAAKLVARVEKVAFLGTPHTGSDLANRGDRLRIMIRPSAATICLVRNDPNLRDLNLWYRDWANARNISHLVLIETKPLRILGMMVKPDSSDPGLAGARPIPIDGNHWTLCKPRDKTSDIYVQVAAFIERRFERPKASEEAKLDALSESQRILLQKSDAIMTLLQRQQGMPRAALVNLLVRLGARDDIADEDIPKFLERFANEFSAIQEQLRRITNDHPEVLAVRKGQPIFSMRETLMTPRRCSRRHEHESASCDRNVRAKKQRFSPTKPASTGSNSTTAQQPPNSPQPWLCCPSMPTPHLVISWSKPIRSIGKAKSSAIIRRSWRQLPFGIGRTKSDHGPYRCSTGP